MPVLMDNKGPKRQCNIYSAKFTKRGSNSQNKKIITWETGLLRHNLKHQSYSSLNWFLTFQHWDCLKKRRMDALASNGAHQSCLTSPMVASQLCWWKPYVKPTRVGASAAPSLVWFMCCASPQFPHSQNRGGLLTNNSVSGLSKVLGSNSRLMFLGRVSCFNTCFSISRSRNSGKWKRKSKSHKSAFIIFSSPFLCEARDHQRKHTGNAALKFIPRVRKHR